MSRLEDVSLPFRDQNVARNDYDNNDAYNGSHSNALSNGDEKGKGEVNGSVGGATDIKTREKELVKNKFTATKQYNASTA